MVKRVLIVVLGLLALMAVAYSQSQTRTKAVSGKAIGGTDPASQLRRGEFLVRLGGCNDCHSPKVMTQMGPVPDSTRLLCGHPAEAKVPAIPSGTLSPDGWVALTNSHLTAWAGPWGVSYAANLTPDEGTGLGNWTEEAFIKTMRTGKHMGAGRNILPPMPWQAIGTLSDSDLKAIFAYLHSLKPVRNEVPQPIPPAGQ
jgi:cytochrome c553